MIRLVLTLFFYQAVQELVILMSLTCCIKLLIENCRDNLVDLTIFEYYFALRLEKPPSISKVKLYSAFQIKSNQSMCLENQRLGDSQLNTLRSEFRELSVVVIDEVSMVGRKMLALIDDRLKQIRGSNEPFGGVSMIFVGDMFQLKPVFDEWIFEFAKRGSEALASNVWQDNVKLFELTTIMRQKDDKTYAELLNRMREGNHTEGDVKLLKTRLIQPGECVNVPHLCCLNSSVDEHNRKLLEIAVKHGADNAVVTVQHITLDSGTLAKRNLQQFLDSKKSEEACAVFRELWLLPLVKNTRYL